MKSPDSLSLETHSSPAPVLYPATSDDVLLPSSPQEIQTPSSETKSVGNTTPTSESLHRADLLRRFMQEWVELSEESSNGSVPPVCIVMFPDLLERIWPWERLLPDIHGSVDWHAYKSYLLLFLEKKKNALKVATGEVALVDAVNSVSSSLVDVVNRCIEAEGKLVRNCHHRLSSEEIFLVKDIKARARDLVQSVGEYPVAAATLLAITKEAELMVEMEIRSIGSIVMRALAHQIRCAAFNLILYRRSESGAVIALMVGVIEECKLILDALREDDIDADDILDETAKMRRGIAKVLTKLDQELCEAVNAGTVTSETKKLIGDDEKGNMKPGKSLHNVVEDSGHALKNNETGSKAVAFSPPLSVDEPRTHGWDNEDVQTQGMEKHSSHQHLQCDRHKKRYSHQRLKNSGRQCLGTELQHDHSKTIILSGNDEDEQENRDGNTSSSSGSTGPSRGRSKRRNDAKPVPCIEEPAATKAQNRCQGQEFSMTSCLAVLNDMVDLSDDVKIQASEVFKDPLSREIFLGYETRLRALWLTKEVNKLGTLSNAS